MDEIICHFRRISNDLTNPLETLVYLSICCPKQLKFTTSRLGDFLWSAHIKFEDGGGSFVISHHDEHVARTKVAQQAYIFLQETTERYEIEERMIAEAEHESIRSVIEAWGYEIETRYEVVLDGETFETVHKCTLDIPGFGTFQGRSYRSRGEAYAEASQKLADFYRKYLTVNIKPKLTIVPSPTSPPPPPPPPANLSAQSKSQQPQQQQQTDEDEETAFRAAFIKLCSNFNPEIPLTTNSGNGDGGDGTNSTKKKA